MEQSKSCLAKNIYKFLRNRKYIDKDKKPLVNLEQINYVMKQLQETKLISDPTINESGYGYNLIKKNKKSGEIYIDKAGLEILHRQIRKGEFKTDQKKTKNGTYLIDLGWLQDHWNRLSIEERKTVIENNLKNPFLTNEEIEMIKKCRKR